MEREKITQINKTAWDDAAPIHAGDQRFSLLVSLFKQPGFSTLSKLKEKILLDHGLDGKSVFQPCCHNGRELLSIKNLGAKECTGFDLSDEFIKQARHLAATSGIECEFQQADIYNISTEYNDRFDIAYISAGTFMWLPDLDGFFSVIARLLRQGARMFIIDQHPILDMLGLEPSQQGRNQITESYFRTEPYIVKQGLDYYRVKPIHGSKPCYRFHHKLSDIINASIKNGFKIEAIEELPIAVAAGYFKCFEGAKYQLPLGFTMTACLV